MGCGEGPPPNQDHMTGGEGPPGSVRFKSIRPGHRHRGMANHHHQKRQDHGDPVVRRPCGRLPPVVCSTVTVVNTGGSAVSFNGGVDWKLQDPDGVARDTTPGGTDTLLGSGELAPSSAVARDVCFDNTAGAPGQYALIYTPAFAPSGDRAVWLSTR